MKNRVYLLDSNLLVALADDQHSSHRRAAGWFTPSTPFATCPVTQGFLVRFYMRQTEKGTIAGAKALLRGFTSLPGHEFWADDIGYEGIPEKGVIGHRQVTDAYLVALASRHGGVLATLDKGLAAIHPGVLLV